MADDRRTVLIGGAPGVGKSTVGRALAARRGVASLTLDDVMCGVRAATTPASHPVFHPMGDGGHVPYFTTGPPDRLVRDALTLERATWPIVRSLVNAHAATPIVIDWWLLRPSDVVTLDRRVAVGVWIHLDADALRERERRNEQFVSGSPDPERMLANFMHRSIWRNELVAEETEHLALPLVRLDGSEPVDVVVDLVTEAVAD